MAPQAPSCSTTGGKKHSPRPTPARRVGILATDTKGWSPLNFPTKRPSFFRHDEAKEQKRPPANKALLIGIQYERNDDYDSLLLAHKDVQKVKDMLINVYKFNPKDIVVLLDDGKSGSITPTKAAILREIKSLMYDVREGDQLYFHYSGHGEQRDCVERDPTEDDDKDECIVPCDAKNDDPDSWIIDNTLNDMLVKTLPIGAYLMAVFDMCHSGTALDLKNHYYAEEGTFIRRCSRKFTNLSRHVSRAFSRFSSRSPSHAQPSQRSGSQPTSGPSREQSKDKMEKCLVITSERLSASKVKSRKLTVSIDPTSSPMKRSRERPRQFSMSKSEKVYKLEHHLMDITGSVPRTTAFRMTGSPSMKGKLAKRDVRRLSEARVLLPSHPSAELLIASRSLKRPSTFPPPQISESSTVDRDCGHLDFIPRASRTFTEEHYSRMKGKSKTKVEKEWNVFSTGGLKKRKSTVRAVYIDARAAPGLVEMSETRSLRPISPSEKVPADTILPSGYIFDSPPGSPASSKAAHVGAGYFGDARKESLPTGQVISIGAATDAQMAMEYACKDKDNKYKLKSLTATLVDILSDNPHPTLANLMVHLSVWLKESSEEMHRHYERRRDNPPPLPSDPIEREMHLQENDVQTMVLDIRPIQEPVLGTQNKTDINEERFLPFSQRLS